MTQQQAFVTFANTSYMTTNRIRKQAEEFGCFTKIECKTEHSIPDFVSKHAGFIGEHKPGYGRWIWKPKVILDSLLELQEGDILVYADAGTYINKNGLPRYKEYLSYLNSEKCMCVFSVSDAYNPQYYCNKDAIRAFYPPYEFEKVTACYAGLMILYKSESSVKCIQDWLGLCENHEYLNYGDCDNALFNLCLSKYKDSIVKIYPDEVNLYKDGLQFVHTNITDKEYREADWSSLDHIPFQVRRITPKFGFPL